jgi:thiamine transport system permease protein
MAARTERLTPAIPGFLVAGAIGLILSAALFALLGSVNGEGLRRAIADPYLWHVLVFTFVQAALSTLVSVVPAVFLARALARRASFPGRGLLIRLLGLPMVVPAIVAVFGIVAIWGQAGAINNVLAASGFKPWTFLYGLPGILIGHAFFNLPLATRLLLPGWASVPGETWRLAAQLGMRSGAIFRLIEWPLLRERLPGVVTIVFLLCMTSFAVVLTLGGGPAATTIEVAIYQALRFDFDPSRAAVLAFLQLALSVLLILASQRWTRAFDMLATAHRPAERPDRANRMAQALDALVIVMASVFVLLPLASVSFAGLLPKALTIWSETRLWAAMLRSLVVALLAGLSAVGAALALQYAIRELRRAGRTGTIGLLDLSASLVLGLSPLAFGAGLFLLLVDLVGAFRWSLAPVVLLSAFLALPYAMRLLGPALQQSASQHDRLCASLGLRGWNRWRLVDWPALRPSIGFALALSVALAVGDLASIALFGAPDNETLPLLLYRLIGSYRMDQAAGVALAMIALVALIFMGIERYVGGPKHARD